jgi:hypothetical protein
MENLVRKLDEDMFDAHQSFYEKLISKAIFP